jgi:hypothetical protein
MDKDIMSNCSLGLIRYERNGKKNKKMIPCYNYVNPVNILNYDPDNGEPVYGNLESYTNTDAVLDDITSYYNKKFSKHNKTSTPESDTKKKMEESRDKPKSKDRQPDEPRNIESKGEMIPPKEFSMDFSKPSDDKFSTEKKKTIEFFK